MISPALLLTLLALTFAVLSMVVGKFPFLPVAVVLLAIVMLLGVA